jgi:hypothetical protein
MIDATGSYVFNKKINFPKLCAARINNNSGMTSSFFLLLFFNDRSHHSCCLDIFTVSRFSIMMENETKIWIRVIDGRRESVVIYLFFVARLSHTAQFAVWFSIVRVKPTVSRGFDDDRPECGPWWMRPGNSPPHVYPFQTLVLHYNLTFGHVSFILLLRGWKM